MGMKTMRDYSEHHKVVTSSPHNYCDGGKFADGGAVSEMGAGSASSGAGGHLTTADVTEKPTYMDAVKDRIASMVPSIKGHSKSTPAAGDWGETRTDATLKEADRQSE